MDSFVFKNPTIEGNSIITGWELPVGITITQKISLVENGTLTNFLIKNKDKPELVMMK